MTQRHGFFLAAALLLCAPTLAAAEASKAETDAFNFAQGLYVYRDFKSAAEEFRAFVKKYPASDKAAEARYRLADALFQERQFETAATAYDDALRDHPGNPDAPRAREQIDHPGPLEVPTQEVEQALLDPVRDRARRLRVRRSDQPLALGSS